MKGLFGSFCTLVLSLALSTITSAQITNGLVNWSTFDDGTGADSSVQSTHGVVNGAVMVPGVASGALKLDGIDDFVAYGNPAVLNMTNAMTISCWFKPVSFYGNGNNAIVDKGSTSHSTPYYQYHLGIGGDQFGSFTSGLEVDAAVSGNYTYAALNSAYLTNQWIHVLGLYDGAALCLFLNGNVVRITPASGLIFTYNSNLFVGKFTNLNNASSFTPGVIDELRIYNRALNHTEIETLYLYPKGKRERVYGNVVLEDYEAQPAGTLCHFDLLQDGNVVESHDVALGGNGQYTFATALTGSYSISCKASHWLSQISDPIDITPSGVEVNFSQINGDADSDNEVGLVDFGLIATSFGTSIEDAGFIEGADLNGDSEVSLVDYGIFADNFGLSGE